MKVDPSKKSNDLVTTCSAVTYKFLDIKEQPQATDKKKEAPKKQTVTKPGKHA
jgi:hypothetical protein